MAEHDQDTRPPLTLSEAIAMGELERQGINAEGRDTALSWRRRVRWTQCHPGETPEIEQHTREGA